MAIPVLSLTEMRQWETATWESGTTEAEVIDRVGQAIAQWVHSHSRSDDTILIVAGRGHNGDDVRAAATYLVDRAVSTIEIDEPETSLVSLQEALAAGPAMILDGLFGIGLNRPLNEAWSAIVEQLNQSAATRIAIDIPSGFDVAEGKAQGATVRADFTLTVGAPKAGMLSREAAPFVGYIRPLTKVGLVEPPNGVGLTFSEPADFHDFPSRSQANDHKSTRGHLAIFAGSPGYHGAAVLAARAAARTRPGLITLVTDPESYVPVASQLQQTMVHPWQSKWQLPPRCTAAVVGPGLASPQLPTSLIAEVVRLWQEAPLTVVADASALDWLPQQNEPAPGPRIITPHPGEAARLLNRFTSEVNSDRIDALRSLSAKFGQCQVILKGTHTFIGSAEGEIYINASGHPGLAQGGSGDILAGLLGGLMAQPSCSSELDKTLRFAVWKHGQTAEDLETIQPNWTIEDLPAALGWPSKLR